MYTKITMSGFTAQEDSDLEYIEGLSPKELNDELIKMEERLIEHLQDEGMEDITVKAELVEVKG